MFLGPGKFFEGDKTTEKRDLTQVVALEIDLGGVSNHLPQSLITFDRAVVCRDIKVDSVTKLPQYEGLMSAFSVSYFHPALLLIYIKALKPSYPTKSTKL